MLSGMKDGVAALEDSQPFLITLNTLSSHNSATLRPHKTLYMNVCSSFILIKVWKPPRCLQWVNE